MNKSLNIMILSFFVLLGCKSQNSFNSNQSSGKIVPKQSVNQINSSPNQADSPPNDQTPVLNYPTDQPNVPDLPSTTTIEFIDRNIVSLVGQPISEKIIATPLNSSDGIQASGPKGIFIDRSTGSLNWENPVLGTFSVDVTVTRMSRSFSNAYTVFVSNSQNPSGAEFDLCKSGKGADEPILIIYPEKNSSKLTRKSQAVNQLELTQSFLQENGFASELAVIDPQLSTTYSAILAKDFLSYRQIWSLSSDGVMGSLAQQLAKKIKNAHEQGVNIAIWADNAPHVQEANYLANILGLLEFGATLFTGNSPDTAENSIVIDTDKSELLRAGHGVKHRLFRGLVELSGGVTLSDIDVTKITKSHELLAISPSNFRNIALIESASETENRIIFDAGFTKLIYGPSFTSKGTKRYIKNIACFLAGN